MIDKKLLEDLIENPLAILLVKDQEVLSYLNNLIPYSTGFEIECDKGERYSENDFESIPDIMSVTNDSGEQRYRIPNGIRGIICLYHICYQLKFNSLLNPLSGIHYHIDCTGCWEELKNIVVKDEELILAELDTWGFRGTQMRGINMYGVRHCGSWVRFNDLRTLEFRVGNMTFDYNIILKNIISANSIVKKLKDQLMGVIPHYLTEYIEPDKAKLVTFYKAIISTDRTMYNRIIALNKELDKFSTKSTPNIITEIENIKQKYRNRVHFINLD